MRDETDIETTYPWLKTVQAQGWQSSLAWFLEMAEPIGVLIAPALWIAQPASRAFGAADFLGDMAYLLETPDERERLQHWLHDNSSSESDSTEAR